MLSSSVLPLETSKKTAGRWIGNSKLHLAVTVCLHYPFEHAIFQRQSAAYLQMSFKKKIKNKQNP